MSRLWLRLGLWSYLICSFFFVYGALLAGDWIGICGSLAFMFGAIFFLLAHYMEARNE